MFDFLRAYGYAVVFFGVLAENLGFPLPSYALVLAAASMAAELHFSLVALVAVSVLAAVAGDVAWYALGRSKGRPVLRTLCSISLNPDSCVSRTENFFTRHGLKSLLVSKFVPALNTVAPPLAGLLEVPPERFLLVDLAGAALWAGSATALGWIFRAEVVRMLNRVNAVGRLGLLILLAGLAVWLVYKWLERRRFYRLLEGSRISAPELKEMLDHGASVAVVDLRSDLTYSVEGLKVRGAIHIPPSEFESRYREIPPDRPVVMYCT